MNLVDGAMSSASVDYNDKETAHKFPNVSQTGEGYAQTKKTCRNHLIIRILSNATPCGCQVPLQGSQQVSTCSHAVTLDFVMACFFDILGNNMCFSFYMFKTSSHGHPAANIKISNTYFLYAYSHVLFWLRKYNKNYNF